MNRHGGFTLQELLIVITIIGILAAVAVPRFVDRGGFDLAGYQQELAAGLRFAQKYAFTSGCPTRVTVSSGGFTAHVSSTCTTGDFTTPIPHPGRGGSLTSNTPSGLTLSPATVTFHADVRASGDSVITLTSDSSASHSIEIIAKTGYVDIQ